MRPWRKGILVQSPPYRADIDGLRALAVIAVLLFHIGWLPNGYLGVDVFFVISGYLITGIIQREISEGRFSAWAFYMRRARRILPLSLVVVLLSLLVGLLCMLPDDLENLSQSAVATNLWANNVLQAVTTKNYWDVVNEYKPLMHTWSLGVEEQFYMLYPAFFLIARRWNNTRLALGMVVFTGFVSFLMATAWFPEYVKFYLLPFRFYELAAGGLVAIALKEQLLSPAISGVPLAGLILILCGSPDWLPHSFLVPAVVALSAWIVATGNERSTLVRPLVAGAVIVAIGRISYSLYMWHQPVLAFTRYALVQQPDQWTYLTAVLVTGLLSIGSYFLVEKPCRDARRFSTRAVVALLTALFVAGNGLGIYLYSVRGVIRDVPELGVVQGESRVSHSAYNGRIRAFARPFIGDSRKCQVLVIGNSFARDWANVLLESPQAETLEISYVEFPANCSDLMQRLDQADVVFNSPVRKAEMPSHLAGRDKMYVVGIKNFGCSAGYFYNYRGPDYFGQRTEMEAGYFERNEVLRSDWENRYIDLITPIMDEERRVPVFTPEGLFISQDCRHLTPAGASFYALILADDIEVMLRPWGVQKPSR